MDWELIWWVVVGAIVFLPLVLDAIGFNWDCFKKDDPYKNCPKGDY